MVPSVLKMGTGFRNSVIGLYVLVASAYLALVAIDPVTVKRLGWEDGLIESAGALCFLVAALVFGVLCIRWGRSGGERSDAVTAWPKAKAGETAGMSQKLSS